MPPCLLLVALTAADPLAAANVVWTTPSRDSSGSMPLGNGDVALNAWVEESGDLVLLLAKSDAWSGNTRLLKLGRLRVRLDPRLPTEPFRCELRLREACLRVDGGAVGMALWVDAHRPIVRLDIQSEQPVRPTVELELWRTARRRLVPQEMFSAYGFGGGPEPVFEEADSVVPRPDALVWFHRNTESAWPGIVRHQGLGSLLGELRDPLLHRTFGGLVRGDGLAPESPTRLAAGEARRRWAIDVVVHGAQTDTAEAWLAQLHEAARAAPDRRAHEAWWRAFWERSWIRVEADSLPQPLESRRITPNDLPLRIGADSNGQNRFRGEIGRARVWSRALTAEEVARLAAERDAAPDDPALLGDWRPAVADGFLEIADSPALDLTEALTLEAWIRPEALPPGGARILDKSRAGTANGYLLDTYPGNSLRLITAWNTLRCDAQLRPGEWAHVAATHDSSRGRQALYVNGREVAAFGGAAARNVGQVLTQGYALQRYLNACAGRGGAPIKFNGSLFTVDMVDNDYQQDPDYRRWGAPYWFQNTRLPYWSMIAAGDFDLLEPLFGMYLEALPLARARTRLYFDHAGAYFPETMYFFGAYANENYGWDRAGKHPREVDNTYIRYYYDGALELCWLGLQAVAAGHEELLERAVLPLAREIVAFYDEHYPRVDGRLRIEPSQALETWQQASDPLPPIAGLQAVLDGLLARPEVIGADRAAWSRLRNELPPLPVGTDDGAAVLLPARQFDLLRNVENPELYAVFPYRLVAVGRGNLALGRASFARRRNQVSAGWQQNAIQAAYLGLAEQAASDVYGNFSTSHAGSRFPAFWGPNYDWVPDQDHGCVAMIALQSMILQADENQLYVLPAWPAEWNVSAKLHARGGPVEMEYRDGELRRLTVNGVPVRAADRGRFRPGGNATRPRRGER